MFAARTVVGAVDVARPVLSEYRGVSDHVPHLQQITVAGQSFVLGTFNLLRPSNMPTMNYQPMYPGQKLPAWLGPKEDGWGLQDCPFANPYLQEHRIGNIVNQILNLFQTSQRVVLCLQECEATVSRQLETEGANLFHIYKDDERRCSILCSRELDVIDSWTEPECALDFYLYPAGEDESPISVTIYNVHLSYTTAASKIRLRSLLADPANTSDHTFVVGDFNVPCMPQSALARAKCTADLVQISDWLQEQTPGLRPYFALHVRGWTNWVPRKNCQNPSRSWDHMDNLMYLAYEGQHPPSAMPLNWCVEMY